MNLMSDFVMEIDVLNHVMHHTKISKRLDQHFFVKISIYHVRVIVTRDGIHSPQQYLKQFLKLAKLYTDKLS